MKTSLEITPEITMTTNARLDRIEEKLDSLTEAMIALARAEEKIASIKQAQDSGWERMNHFSKKLDSIEEQVRDKLDDSKPLQEVIQNFYKNPDLQISIEEFNSSKVYVVGAVRNQITIELNQKPIRLLEAAIKANFNPSAADKLSGTKGLLRRDNKVYKVDLLNAFQNNDQRENFYLKKDDVLFIDRNSDAIHVFGEVTKPGVYFPNMDYSLTELISTGGLNQLTANARKVYVIREKLDSFLEVDVFQLDIKNPINLIAGRKFLLHERDIVFIPPTNIVKWNRTISLLLPQTNLFKSYNPIINNGLETYKEP